MRMAPVPYTETEIHHRLEEVPGWQYRAGSLCRTFAFADFAQAFAFMAAVAAEAEKANHHPMWKNRYGRVEIWLRTHEVDGITAKDFDLAAACSRHGHIAQIEPTGPYPMRVKVRNTAGHSLPAYESMHAAGMDVRACLAQPLSLAPGAFQAIGTGLYLEIPEGYEIQLRPRSGLAAKHGITLLNSPGTLDADYRGEVKVILINHGTSPFLVEDGMRIAQMLLAPVTYIEWEPVEALEATERGEGGFGHTGV